MAVDVYDLFYDEGGTLRARLRGSEPSARTDPRQWSEDAISKLISDVWGAAPPTPDPADLQ